MAQYQPPRWSNVPWLEHSDLEEGRRCCWEIDLRVDEERVSCWPVTVYEDRACRTEYLVMRAVRGNGNDGGAITLSVSETPRYDRFARESFAAKSDR